MTDPRAYLADVLAKAEAVDEYNGKWWWVESSSPGLGNVFYESNGLPGEYNLPGCGHCGETDQVFESFVGEFIAQSRTTSPAMARALVAVVELHRQLRFHQDYDRCGHAEGEHIICHSAGGDPLCEQTFTLSDPPVCEVCLDEMGYHLAWPCETYQAITAELAKEIEHG